MVCVVNTTGCVEEESSLEDEVMMQRVQDEIGEKSDRRGPQSLPIARAD